MKSFGGKVLFLDRGDINTDEIIPARYLTEASREALKPYLLEDLKLAGFNGRASIEGAAAIVTRQNFGCGSSREHAPWALEMNGINIVVASGFARIFRQNMYNCGLIACELPAADIDSIFAEFASRGGSGGVTLKVDLQKCTLSFSAGSNEKSFAFSLQGFERALVESGGWVEYAAQRY